MKCIYGVKSIYGVKCIYCVKCKKQKKREDYSLLFFLPYNVKLNHIELIYGIYKIKTIYQ